MKGRSRCFQSVKDIKFESNSQHDGTVLTALGRCFQSVKDIKFESNSQLWKDKDSFREGCFQSVKDIKFESNSQPNSQLSVGIMTALQAVSSLSKI